MQKSQLRGEI